MDALRHLFFCGVVVVGVIGVGGSWAVSAQELPCTDEIQRFCADVQPGKGRIVECLRRHEAQLSPACVQRIADFAATINTPVGRACREDWAALCYHPRAATDRQAMLDCVKAHRAKVSAGCRKALDDASGKPQQRRGMVP